MIHGIAGEGERRTSGNQLHEDLAIAVDPGGEGDGATVGRERRGLLETGEVSQRETRGAEATAPPLMTIQRGAGG